jgi:hypothetical protein
MKKIILALTVLGLAFCLSGPLNAQPLPNEQGNGATTGGDPIRPQAPIGGGAAILVAFGIAYAVSRYSFNKKEE